MKQYNIGGITYLEYQINNIPLTNELLSSYIDNFWSNVFENSKDKHLYLLCKIKFTDIEPGYRTLGHLVKVNYEDKELFHDYLSQRLSILSDSYVTHPICQIIFSYIIKDGLCDDESRAILLEDLSDKEITNHNFNNMELPITMDPLKYGTVELSSIIEDGSSV